MSDQDTQDPNTDDFVAKLNEFGADDAVVEKIKELGVTTFDDLSELREEDLIKAGIKVVQARRLLKSLAPATPEPQTATPVSFDGILPSVPEDGSWLEALKTGGVLKVDESTVIGAVRAALASQVGLYDVPRKLADAMERFADQNDEPVDSAFFALRKQITQTNYAEIFEAVPGLDGSFVSDARKKELFARINDHLWPAIAQFYSQLSTWQDVWMQQGANPAVFMSAIAAMGGNGPAMPAGMMQPPETDGLRDHADAVNDAINRVFAGTGVQIAVALAYNATQIRKTLEDTRLPAMIGAANREQMLKQLDIAISSTYPRLENNLTRFVLATMQVKNQVAGNEELQYFGTLSMLGAQIPWDTLNVHGVAGIGGRGHRL